MRANSAGLAVWPPRADQSACDGVVPIHNRA